MRVNEDIAVRDVLTCLFCQTRGILFYSQMRDQLFDAPGVWDFLRCPECGFVWLNPAPIPEDLEKIYADYYTHSSENPKPTFASLRRKMKHSLLGNYFGYYSLLDGQINRWMGKALGLISPLRDRVGYRIMWLDGTSKGKLLDVGCGNGQFLAAMQELGWEVMGIEPDEQAAKYARARFGIRVLIGRLEEIGFPDNSFDAVTMNHVIEHVHDPVGLLNEAWRVLKPDGRLVIVTPNIESFGHRLFQQSWLGLDPPRHLQIFSLRTLRHCAERSGLEIRTLKTIARSAHYIWATSRMIQRYGTLDGGLTENFNWSLRLVGFAFQLLESALLTSQRNVGEEIVLTASRDRQ